MHGVTALGTSSALALETREHTYLLVRGNKEAYLIDCGGSPLQRLRRAEMELEKLEGLIITHHHPDHIYGVPALLSGLWLHGRKRPLHIYGPEQSIVILREFSRLLAWDNWPNWLPLIYHSLPAIEELPVLASPEFSFWTSPARHGSTTSLAVRVEVNETGGRMVYSSDTEPCEEVVQLAQGADLLIHEASGHNGGHSTAAEAGSIAQQAQVKRLVLVHYPRVQEGSLMVQQAQEEFPGPVELADDFSTYQF